MNRRALVLLVAGAALGAGSASSGLAANGASSAAAASPSTRITHSPGAKTFDRRVRFGFDSPSDPSARFRCSLDDRGWSRCAPPHRTRRLGFGRHSFEVRAVAAGGAVDPTPARRRFRVVRRRLTFGHSVHGTELRAVRLGNPNAERKALVVGSIHGDEPEGHEITRILTDSYRHLRGVELWVVKTVNPDGVRAGTRKNAHGVDLNRNFSYRWRSGSDPSGGYYPGPHPFSEPESRAVKRLVGRLEPGVTIWYHQPWGHVLLPCHGPAPLQKRYARIARWPTDRCRGAGLHGTATSWENHRFPGTAFVVELRAGELPNRQARRHARAAARVAAGGPSSRRAAAGGSELRGAASAVGATLGRPPIHPDPIPYGHKRKHQMAAYVRRHYGRHGWRLRNPRVIVLHFTDTSGYRPVWSTFASNSPNMGERPGVCSHFVIAKHGRIHQLVRPSIRCRHTIGLNHLAFGVEMVQEQGRGSHWADRQILHRHRQIHSALRLVGWLKQRYHIQMRDVIGHAMANHSRFFKDLEGWRNDHTDWLRHDVREFRHRLRRLLHRSAAR